MSSARGGERGGFRGRGRGAAHINRGSGNTSDGDGAARGTRGRGRGGGSTRAATASSASTRGAPPGPRQRQTGGPQQPSQPRPPSRSNNATPKPNGVQTQTATSGGSFAQRYQTLKSCREHERRHAIATGLIADPDKPRRLEDAITIVGACRDMCAEYERVERVVQKDVWEMEHEPGTKEPAERRMVKKFRRAAAGLEEQLPSDLRPPYILRKTCDYLFNAILSETSLEKSHHFIWDRTRAIRNDFTIQQCTKTPDIRIQIDCFERIARFHILSLHHLAVEKVPSAYNRHQDREQLDKTLLSLMNLYDANRARYRSPNEAEFRAYCIIFELRALVPDIEDRVQTWPSEIVRDPRIQRALKLYAAAGDIIEPSGPLNPRICHPIAQSNTGRFFKLVKSNEISYLMACVAEVEFNAVRKSALNSIWRAYRQGGNTRTEDWTLQEVTKFLAFDDEEETRTFCEAYGFSIAEKEDGNEFLDLTSVQGRALPDSSPNLRKQFRSEMLVEVKRHGRTLSAVIDGLSVRAAKDRGMIEEQRTTTKGTKHSLFVSADSDSDTETKMATPSSFTASQNPFGAASTPATAAAFTAPMNPFGSVSASPFAKPFTPAAEGFGGFAKAVETVSTTSTPAPAAPSPFSAFSAPSTSTSTTATPAAIPTSSPFQLAGAASASASLFAPPSSTPLFANASPPTASPFQPSAQSTAFSNFGQPPAEAQKSTTPSTTPSGSFEKPSATPPGSPPKSFNFTGLTSSSQAPALSTAPLLTATTATTATDNASPSKGIFGFSPVSQSYTPGIPTSTTGQFSGSKPASTPGTPAAANAEAKNPFGFAPSQLSGASSIPVSLKPSHASASTASAAPASAFQPPTFTNQPTTIPSFFPTPTSTSQTADPPASKFSIGAFNPSKFSAPTSAAPPAPSPAALPSLGNYTPSPPALPKSAATPSAPLSFTPTPPAAPAAAKSSPQPAAPTPSLPPAASTALAATQESAYREKVSARICDKVTEDLVLEPRGGLLTQFVEHIADDIILDVLKQFEEEQNGKVADEFRARSLAIRYVRLWRDIWWSNHLRRRGRERRKARRSAINAAAAQPKGKEKVEADVRDFKRSMGQSARRVSGANGAGNDGFRDSFSSSIGVQDLLDRNGQPAQRSLNLMMRASQASGRSSTSEHRRSKTQPDAIAPNNNNHRVSKSKKAPLQPPTQIRYRAAFLSGQPLIPKESTYTGRISTTQTDYFRLKALGINYDDIYGDRKKKRYRDVDDEGEEPGSSAGDSRSASPPERKKRPAFGTRSISRQSRTPSGEDRAAATPTSAPSTYPRQNNRPHVDDQDDALIARFRAVKQSLDESIDYFRTAREQIERDDFNSSRGSSADPLARSYSSFRQSHFPQVQSATSSSLPKYWSRESKFLPRSEYGGGRWLAQRQEKVQEKGKEKVVERPSSAKQPIKALFPSQPRSQPVSIPHPPTQSLAISLQVASSPFAHSQESMANAFSGFAPGGSNQLEVVTSHSFSSVVPDSNPFVTNHSNTNGTGTSAGTPGQEIMTLDSDDEDEGQDQKCIMETNKSKQDASIIKNEDNGDDDVKTVDHDDADEGLSVGEDFASQCGQPDSFTTGRFGAEFPYGQRPDGFAQEEIDQLEEEVDPDLLDENDEVEEAVDEELYKGGDGEDDDDSDDDDDDDVDEQSDDEELSGTEDQDGDSKDRDYEDRSEEPSDEDDGEDGVGTKYRGQGNSFDDAIEL